MAWLTLVVAGLFETGFAVALKMSHGMTRLWPTVIFAICALLSFALLTMALRHLEVGAAYAVWTGIGAAGTAVIGMAVLGETVSTMKLVSIGLVLAGVVGLNLSGVTRMDSAGVAVLIEGINEARKDGIILSLQDISPAAKSVLEMARVDKLFQVSGKNYLPPQG